MSDFDTNTQIITYLYLILSIFSVVFSVICIFLYLKFANLENNYAAKLIVLLSIADICGWTPGIITSLESLISQQSQNQLNQGSCIFLAVWKTFFNHMTNICVLLIGFFLFMNVYLQKNPHNFQKLVYFAAFMITVVLTIIPAITDNYGDVDGSTCWIQGYYMRLGVFYIPVIVILLIDFIFIYLTINKIRKMELMPEYQRKLIIKFVSFPLIMLICWGPGTLKRILDIAVDDPNDLLFLKYLMYILMPLQGVFNPIAYLFINDNLRFKFMSFFQIDSGERNSQAGEGEQVLLEHEMQINDDSSSREF